MRNAVALLAAVVCASCAMKQTVQPSTLTTRNVCLIENPAVLYNFDTSLASHLRRKGLSVRVVKPDEDTSNCPASVTYTANWTWDFTPYMRFAQITLIEGNAPAGQAVYDTSNGGMRLDKWVNADKKIGELVDQLFPS